MRIAYLHSGSIPSVYANGVHVMRMCDAFADAGHEVVLYALSGSAPAEDVHAYYGTRNRFTVRTVPLPSVPVLGWWIRAWRVRREVRRDGVPDLLYGRDLRALLLASRLAPLVYETHILWASRTVRAIEQLLFRARGLARVVFVSQALADDYRRAFPRLAARAGVDLVAASDCADPPPSIGESAELPGRPGALKIGYVGHLYPGRGTDVILDLATRLPAADFHLVGGTAEDLAHWRGRPHGANVFFHGHRPPAELHPYYRAFDLVLAPYQRKVACAGGIGDISRWVSPMKMFEYMAHGKALIASDLPVLREVLVDGVNCLLCPPADTAAWERAITRLADDHDLREALGAEARRQLLDRYTWRARVDRVLPARLRSSVRVGF
ncbi:glycosyltransferase family 4 protein [Kitasatospora mediocidica]|uniref:glycosyltransferase family 4 protein n=1 Tax=Kitasatospora mediocidica TaxID=58352 RepID=UPI00068CAC92|nr:glycosyltransferase family 4 protein [Kitasatospora mediocidica]